ncbi:hypothetical protein B0A55_13089 [Friedmanniomyces simplex]|uniref:Uncharacterized protein n=1 Tax=Friedmanniomyces simplex TaxID=329884 RepID=A0A4U0VGH5_9PEZI|nr:hypothetical protein B0A55_13089 [Friedmanniomyces simplex]
MEMLEGIRRARSNMSLSSMASDRSNAPTSNVDEGQGLGMGDLERMAFCLTGTAPAPATATHTPTPTTSKTSATSKKPWDPANLHWRTFGGSGASVKFKRSNP